MMDFPLIISKAYMLAQMTVCPLPDYVPAVEVIFKPTKPEFVTGAPVKMLTEALRGNKDATHLTESSGKWRVFGITEGSMSGSGYRASYLTRTDQSGMRCIYVDSITFEIRYNPTIFIGKELVDSECHYRVTKMHEERHVATDLKTIKEYIPKIKMEILWYLRGLGSRGPFPQGQTDQEATKIMKEVVEYVKPMVEKLFEERRKRQGDIDTIENYKYESGLCPGEWPKIPD
ncbi:MAG TPA: hypothetical protein VEF76_11805 [Patescibacteria group bacterium]|nr:hypothetical protein [Patescibacteria group bacterium]